MESKPLYTKIAIGCVLFVAYISMRAMGLGFGDLWEVVQDQIDSTRAETRAYRESNFNEQTSREMREQAAKASGGSAGPEGDLNNEMATERKHMMDQAAATATENRDKMLEGNAETMSKMERKYLPTADEKK